MAPAIAAATAAAADLGQVLPGGLPLSNGVSIPRATDQPYTSNSPGPHCNAEVNRSGMQSLPAPAPPQQLQPQETSEQQQEQDLQRQQQSLREATTFHGAAVGQIGTSTRQELTAWIRVLAIPCRSCYATDSASMMNKALRLIRAAERDLDEEAKGIKTKRGNPFGKPWGLQVDGDLWEQAWIAVKQRGTGNQTLRKVKRACHRRGRYKWRLHTERPGRK